MPERHDPPIAAPAPVVEIERRLHWRALPVAGFLALMITLAVMAAVSILVPRGACPAYPTTSRWSRCTRPCATDAHARGELRFRSALTGEAAPGATFDAATATRVESARQLVERVRAGGTATRGSRWRWPTSTWRRNSTREPRTATAP